MKKPILITILIGTILSANAQIDSVISIKKDTVIFKGNLWTGDNYSYRGKENLKFQTIKSILNIDAENEKLIANAETAKLFSTIFAGAGGFFMGFAIGGSFSGKPINMPLLGAGAGLVVISIPISSSYVTNMKKAVRNFNKKQ